jgi:hypothetical protein
VPGYTLSDGVTLKNKFGANNVDELAQFETEAVRRRLMEIELGVVPSGQFDAVYLKTNTPTSVSRRVRMGGAYAR